MELGFGPFEVLLVLGFQGKIAVGEGSGGGTFCALFKEVIPDFAALLLVFGDEVFKAFLAKNVEVAGKIEGDVAHVGGGPIDDSAYGAVG